MSEDTLNQPEGSAPSPDSTVGGVAGPSSTGEAPASTPEVPASEESAAPASE